MTVDLRPPDDVVWIAAELERAGYAAWAVGGAVRDALAGGAPEDWDLATAARPSEIRRIFRRTVPVGIDHGTVGVLARSGVMYEVTTFRRDVETFGRRARVSFTDKLEDDLGRRDFTINAVAWHPLTHEVRDPHGGMDDLAAGRLRTVGDPAERFSEDWLRVLRALRFAGAFSLEIEPATWGAVVAAAGHLGELSAERVREELWKVLAGQRDPRRSLRLYAASGALATLYPELERTRGIPTGDPTCDLWEFLVRSAAGAPPGRPLIRVAALLHAAAARQAGWVDETVAGESAALARGMLRRLRASNAVTDTVTHLIAQHAPAPARAASDAEVRRWLRRIGKDYRNDLIRLRIAMCRGKGADCDPQEVVDLFWRVAGGGRTRPALAVADLAIDGSDLREIGIPPGPRMGNILGELLERVIEQPELNDRAKLIDLVKTLTGPGNHDLDG
jgi:tRNA nucleotidyltransferase/poly(A) polymerase